MERQNFAAVNHAWIVRERNDRLARRSRFWLNLAWASHLGIVVQGAHTRVAHGPLWLLARWVVREGGAAALGLLVESRQVELLDCLQFLLGIAAAGSPRRVTYLVVELALNVPLGVFQELVNVFSEHALEVSILHALLRLALVAELLDLGLAVGVLRHAALIEGATDLGPSVLRVKASSLTHETLVLSSGLHLVLGALGVKT